MKNCWNEKWTAKWKKVLIWLSSYLSIIAYALVGGYFIVKNEDESCKKTAKKALVVTLIFTALGILLTLFSGIGGMTDNWYSSDAYKFCNIFEALIAIAKAVTYCAIILVVLFSKEEKVEDKEEVPVQVDEKEEEKEQDE